MEKKSRSKVQPLCMNPFETISGKGEKSFILWYDTGYINNTKGWFPSSGLFDLQKFYPFFCGVLLLLLTYPTIFIMGMEMMFCG